RYPRRWSRIRIGPTATRNVPSAPSFNRVPRANWLTAQSVHRAIAGSTRRSGRRRIERQTMPNLPVCRSPAILIGGIIAVVFVLVLAPRHTVALPLYARQTGQPCATCHTAFLELTPFGRRFKLGGYTLDGGDWKGPPFAVMLQPTFTNTQAA